MKKVITITILLTLLLIPVVGQSLPDLSAKQIYDQAIHSVMWIHTGTGLGSAVLIDEQRRLAVTNQHVTAGEDVVGVVFPYRHNGRRQKDRDFYLGRNFQHLSDRGYITEARVVAENVRHDLAILLLNKLPPTAAEIQSDFRRNVEESMRRGDTVHILGNPGDRLWNWTQGTFLRLWQRCLIGGGALVGCLEMEADTSPGNSGGPVLNGQGVLIGILTAGTDETVSLAATTRNIKALLDTLRPRHVFKIRNPTGVPVPYEIKWSNNNDWQGYFLKTGFVRTHWRNRWSLPTGYPKIRFDHIAGDQRVTYLYYSLETSGHFGENTEDAPTYRFGFNRWGDRLDLFRDARAAPTLSKAVTSVSPQKKIATQWGRIKID